MKALCVKQPWAELIACGQKTWEMRTWTTAYRGPILILASAQASRTDDARAWAVVPTDALGVTICIAELVDVMPIRFPGPRYERRACCHIGRGDYAWTLRDVTRVSAIPVKGRLGLFEAPDDLLERLIGDHLNPTRVLRRVVDALALR